MTAAASSPEDSGTPANCICDHRCYRDDEGSGHALCPYCSSWDNLDQAYDPCPVNGFGCGATGPCDCCTPAQSTAAAGWAEM